MMKPGAWQKKQAAQKKSKNSPAFTFDQTEILSAAGT